MEIFPLVDINLMKEDLERALKRLERAKFPQEKFFIYQYEVLPLISAIRGIEKNDENADKIDIRLVIKSLREQYPADNESIKQVIAEDNQLTQEQVDSLIINAEFNKSGMLVITSKMYKNSINILVGFYNAICELDRTKHYIYDFNKVFCSVWTIKTFKFEDGLEIRKNKFNGKIIFNEKVNINHIDDYFLNDAILFNQPLNLPNNINKIGKSFLSECIIFNQDLILPNSLTSVEINFLNWTRGFYKTINIQNLKAEIFKESINSISCPVNTDLTYKNGVSIVGTYKEDFLQRFPNRDTSPFRNLK